MDHEKKPIAPENPEGPEAKKRRMKELSQVLLDASKAYYQEDCETMSNYEYDRLYDELVSLEKETGIILAGSPTQKVGYESLEELPKERHESPMLSLDKTKEVEKLEEFAGKHPVLVSWKLDGLTVVLTYQGGKLEKAVTRGNGEIGEVITPNAKVFKNIPLTIPFQGRLILRGEAVITYPEFEKINQEMEEAARYKNPRNLCSGSVRQLNNEITAKRGVRFYAFSLVEAEGMTFEDSRKCEFEWIRQQGFDVVEYKKTDAAGMRENVAWFADKIAAYEVPSDGLVISYDEISYGKSLGRTAKFPRDSIAFKWKDEICETRLKEIEWSPSRTGLINPVAVFEPVELEGTTVSRASLHNLSIVKAMKLGIGDVITVYKANMIIPQIAENLTQSNTFSVPETCPACGEKTQIQSSGEVECLICTNPRCSAKKIKSFTLFVSRDALNIEGLSEATLEKLIGCGCIHRFADIFDLGRHREEIVHMEGFGEKSYANLMESIDKARKVTLPRLIYSLGIPGIGVANAKVICRYFHNSLEQIRKADAEKFAEIDGIGGVLAAAAEDFFADQTNQENLDALLEKLTLETEEQNPAEQIFAGKTFVITGSLVHYANRNELKEEIEQKGGKVTGSVSQKTDYLINNDTQSSSSKNKKARQLGIPVISEEEFLQMSRS